MEDRNRHTSRDRRSETRVAPKAAEPPLVLTLDIGSSSVRALVFDRRGRSVEGLRTGESYQLETPEEGAAQIDPDILLERLFRCLDALRAHRGVMQKVRGVGISTLVANILGMDGRGRAVSPVYTYADTRAHPDTAMLRREMDERAVHDRTGCRLHTSYLPARFRWIARTRPGLLRRARRWVSLGEYLFQRVFGQSQVSHSVASWTGLLDRRRLVWDEALLESLPIGAEHLSPLADYDRPLSGLGRAFAGRWPELREIPWFQAVGDGAAANVGTGCVSPRRLALSLGTTAAMRAVTTGRIARLPLSLWCYRVDRDLALLGGALTEGGGVFDWMRKTLRLGEDTGLEEEIASMVPDSHGLTVLPFLAGERSPGWADQARGAIEGLSLRTTSRDILRASLEAVALRLALVYRDLAELVPEVEEVVASGGVAAHSPAWLQIIADALGRPLACSEVVEASSRGAALLALRALGAPADPGHDPGIFEVVYRPDPARSLRYREALERQQDLYRRLVEDPAGHKPSGAPVQGDPLHRAEP